MSKHTPGPWELNQHGSSSDYVGEPWFTVRDPRNVYVAEVHHVDKLIGSEEYHANARLIANAPAMLNTLKALVKHLQEMGFSDPDTEVNGGDLVEEMGDWLPQLKDVIAEAEGKE